MSEEEKKAIENLKDFDYLMLDLNENYEILEKAIETVLDLIGRLQKENNELRDTNKKLYEMGKQNAIQEILNENWISKDKIKDKIKQLEFERIQTKTIQPSKQSYKYAIEVLEDLLEEK